MSAQVKPADVVARSLNARGLSEADVERIRQDFPILNERPHGHKLVFLDSAASSQKPIQVIDAMDDYYRRYHANIHRGVYPLAQEAGGDPHHGGGQQCGHAGGPPCGAPSPGSWSPSASWRGDVTGGPGASLLS